jgi:CDP-glycerol glycerophosphotransferase
MSQNLDLMQARLDQLERAMVDMAVQRNMRAVADHRKKTRSIVFYTPRRLEGNLKYAYLRCVELIKELGLSAKCWCVTLHREEFDILSERNLPVLMWSENEPKPLSELMAAQIVVTDGFLYDNRPTPPLLHAIMEGAKRVNLWHGTPIKKIHLQLLDQTASIAQHDSAIFRSASEVDTLCIASSHHAGLFNNAFSAKRVVVTGYPRNDVLLRALNENDLINVDLGCLEKIKELKQSGKKIFFYAPTWRDGNPGWMTAELVREMHRSVNAAGACLVVNPHPFEYVHNREMLSSIEGVLVPDSPDVYPILAQVDVLITDYSSIIFDYMLLERPIILYRPDHEDYVRKSRNLIPEQTSGLPYLIASNIGELSACIENNEAHSQNEFVRRVKKLHNENDDARSSERVCKMMFKKLGLGPISRYWTALRREA